MQEQTLTETKEKAGQGLVGANETAVPKNPNMNPAHSDMQAANKVPSFRRELLNELLSRKVMYEDISTYKLSNMDIEYLFLCDSVSKCEYLKLMHVIGFSMRTAYRKWWKASFRNFDYKPIEAIRSKMIWIGADAEAKKVKALPDAKRAESIPAREIFRSIKNYVVDLLGRVRADLYNKKTLKGSR